MIELCEKLVLNNNVIFNANKTKCMLFNPLNLKNDETPITLNKVILEYVAHISNLGVIITNKLEDDIEITFLNVTQ